MARVGRSAGRCSTARCSRCCKGATALGWSVRCCGSGRSGRRAAGDCRRTDRRGARFFGLFPPTPSDRVMTSVELPSRYPIGGLLPALYADDDFAQRFTAGLDTMIAPVVSTLDNLAAYFDSRLAPEDFLMWLASWVGAELD